MVCYVDGKVCWGGRGVRSGDRSWDGGVSIGFFVALWVVAYGYSVGLCYSYAWPHNSKNNRITKYSIDVFVWFGVGPVIALA